MTPKEKAWDLLCKMNNANITEKIWSDASPYAKKDLKRKCFIVIDEVLRLFKDLYKPENCAFDCIGGRKFTFDAEYETHMTGYDMAAYYEEVKKEIDIL